ncbi:MAG TPA: hypothetical protein VFI43_08420, partial [Nitrosospira sp.]|nr:hypothetical protein [Nitrosospira sp.]
VTNTVAVYDAVLKVDTPEGPGWHRYTHDGYGQKADGSPYDGAGVGRLWPLLTGERGHYELASGNSAYPYIKTMEAFSSTCCLLPEQVWDSADIPAKHMWIGRPTGSAMPLVWSHAEYIKLLRSVHDGIVFDLIPIVRKRYIDDQVGTDLEVWTFKQKLSDFRPWRRLRIEVYGAALLHWTENNWETAHDIELPDEGLGVFAHEFEKGRFGHATELKFTFYWHQPQRWEGRDFSLQVNAGEPPQAVPKPAEEKHADLKEVFEPALD